MRRISFLVLIASLLPVSIFAAATDLNMGVSPLKFDISAPLGKSTARTITFYNNSNTPYEIYLTTEDCTADRKTGTPLCRATTSSGVDPESLATWITFEGSSRFVVPAKSEKKINFAVTPPSNAALGGHYGGIFLNNVDYTADGGNQIKMIRRAQVLVMVNIPGKLVFDTQIGDIEIDTPLFSAPSDPRFANQPRWRQWGEKILSELDPRVDTPAILDTSDFVVTFTVPVNNKGNTHILPVGRIEMYDDAGILLAKIGKETIRSLDGAFIGEKIVDYLPINDEASNVLASSERLFTVQWKGFAYETIEGGRQVIKFQSPQAYYSQMETQMAGSLMPWEKYRAKLVTKNFNAKISLEYKGEAGELVPYEREQIVQIKYMSIQKDWNYGLIAIIFGIILLVWMFRIFRREDRRIDHLEEEVEFLEEEVDELERAKIMAKSLLKKKKAHALEKVLESLPEKKPRTRKVAQKTVEGVEKKPPVKRTRTKKEEK